MSYPIKSFTGAGPIEFGMTIEQVRNVMGDDFVSFKRTPAADIPNHHYRSLGLIINYRLPGVVKAIEFASPADPEFDDIHLLAISYNELKKLLIARDPDLEIEIDGLTSHKLGIGAYAPHAADEPNSPVEAIIVFEKDYYSSP